MPNPASSLNTALLLTLSGGFLDGFSYVGHGHVFANTMSGNVALLGVSLAAADWLQGARHIPPLIAFVLAVVVSHLLAVAEGRRWIGHSGVACLILEIGFLALAASGLAHINDFWLIPGITFVATLQTLAFSQLENLTYTSVMTTGNLRNATQHLLAGLWPRRNHQALRNATLLGYVSAAFLAGAVLGAFTTAHWHDAALWLPVAMLIGALWIVSWLKGARA